MNHIILDFDMHVIDKQVYMTFIYEPKKEKQFFLFVSLDQTSQPHAFWKGMTLVLQPLLRKFPSSALMLKGSELMFTLHGGTYKETGMRLLEHFRSVLYQEGNGTSTTTHNQILQTGLHDLSIKNNVVTVLKDLNVKATKKEKTPGNKSLPYYRGISLPDNAVVFDFETTNRIIQFSRLIEIGAVKLRNGKIVDEFSSLVNPGIKIPKEIRQLTNISNEDVQQAPKGFTATKKFLEFIKDTPYLIGHHITYDYQILKRCCEIFSLPMWEGEIICTEQLAREQQLYVENYKLDTLCRFFSIINSQPHRALPDAKATTELYLNLRNASIFTLL